MTNEAFRQTRRRFLLSTAAVAGVAAAGGVFRWAGVAEASADSAIGKPGKVTIIRFSDDGKNLGPETVDKVVKTLDEWRAYLKDAPAAGGVSAFEVTRQEGTEWAGTGPNSHNFSAGLYRCICCDNALYTNETKFDSGTGWPSFWAPIAKENVLTGAAQQGGHKVWCALCDAHLGHVFDDGRDVRTGMRTPTGLRYCMDGVAMRFIAWPTT